MQKNAVYHKYTVKIYCISMFAAIIKTYTFSYCPIVNGTLISFKIYSPIFLTVSLQLMWRVIFKL